MKTTHKLIWIAVRVERGFVTEALPFLTKRAAERRESRWRAVANPDYDETAVFARRIMSGDVVQALGRAVVADAGLRAERVLAERDEIDADWCALAVQRHRAP